MSPQCHPQSVLSPTGWQQSGLWSASLVRHLHLETPSLSLNFCLHFLPALSQLSLCLGQPHPPWLLRVLVFSTKADQITLDGLHRAIPARCLSWCQSRSWIPVNCLDKSEWLLPHSAPYRNRLKPLTTGTHIPCTQVVFLRLTFPLFPSWTLQEASLATAWGCEVGAGFPLSNGRPTLSSIAPSAKWGWQQQRRPHGLVMVLGGDDFCKIFSMNTECVIRVIHFYIAQMLQTRRYSTFDMKMLLPVVLCYTVLPHYVWNNPWISSPFPTPDFIFGPRCMYFSMPWISWNWLHTT